MNSKDFEERMKEFPFLWGIRQKWHSKHTVIRIHHADEGLDTVLSLAHKNEHEIWLQSSLKEDGIKQITRYTGQCGYRAIKVSINNWVTKEDVTVHYIIIVSSDNELMQISIYKPPKKDLDFIFWLS